MDTPLVVLSSISFEAGRGEYLPCLAVDGMNLLNFINILIADATITENMKKETIDI